jgi:hypothetical protein
MTHVAVAVPLLLGALELGHPTWSDASTAQGVLGAGQWWIPLHLLLIAGYAGLVWTLWGPSSVTRVILGAFLGFNTAFLAVDGIAVGLLAQTDPVAANTLWASPMVAALAVLMGATWSAALLGRAATLSKYGRARGVRVGLALIWVTYVLSSFLSPPLTSAFSRVAALAVGASLVYAAGVDGLALALLTFAAVIRQHAGPEAALGMLCIAVAAALSERSGPVAGSQP